jgi:phenylacetic acid degradation operon negative regulatory protein
MPKRPGGQERSDRGITVSRLTARSVVLSVLLGAHPAWASASELVRLTADFGIKEPTLRVALTRMVGAGDLVRSADGYRLSERLLARQRRQDDALDPRLRRWDGTWRTLVITSVGTDARTRALLRATLHDKRFAELREGVWMRPANLELELTDFLRDRVRVLQARDDDPAGLTARLWDLAAWVDTGRRLLADMSAASDVPRRFAAAAGMVRHLLTDPVLPDELLPDGWPGAQLRSAYHDFATELAARRDDTELMEAT